MGKFSASLWGGFGVFGKAFGAGMCPAFGFAPALSLRQRHKFWNINQMPDLITQYFPSDFLDALFGYTAKLKGAIANSNKPVHG